jgi:hypothetical protein
MKISRFIALLLAYAFSFNAPAQELTQNIRGTVVDKESKSSLPGVTILLLSDTSKIVAASTDVNGNFRLEKVKVGRHKLKLTLLGYKEVVLSNIIVNSGKETVLSLEMEESVESLGEVTVMGVKKDQSVNEMATVSTRTFSIEETERYAGSRSDPARMASNFAGVQGADDSRNDIVIRGNSPMGLLYRVEGVDIPNPNHFAIPGTTGGGVSVLNSKTFSTSDFMTGAFPAEYGNAIAGVFDLRLRNGNNEKHEFTGQFGFLGTELMAEGPISKTSGSSYMAAYRYSTLKLFESLNLNIGTNAVPNYQDLTFKLNFPSKKGTISIFGVGGTSKIAILISKDTVPSEDIYGMNDRDQYFGTSVGMVGITHARSISSSTYSKLTISAYTNVAYADHYIVSRDSSYKVLSITDKMHYNFTTNRISGAYALTKKINPRNTIKAGINADQMFYDFIDSNRVTVLDTNLYQYMDSTQLASLNTWEKRLDDNTSALLIQPYVQWKHKLTDNLEFNTGIHGIIFTMNTNSMAIEPRAGMRWSFKPNQALSLGYGMHSQTQPSYIYLHQVKDRNGRYVQHNRNLGLTRNQHVVAGYDLSIKASTRLKMEAYYQWLDKTPVEINRSSFSLLNQGSMFSRFFPDSLQNTGKGNNMGAELTLERFFSKSYFFMLTASVFDSKYTGSDGVRRNTDFNGNFAVNALGAKEFALGKKKNTVLTTGAKVTWAGGRRYAEPDSIASALQGETVFLDSKRNEKQFRDYFRTDLKIGVKINTKKLTHEIALDLVNIFNTKNVLSLSYVYDPSRKPAHTFREEYQLGFLPLFYYKVDF